MTPFYSKPRNPELQALREEIVKLREEVVKLQQLQQQHSCYHYPYYVYTGPYTYPYITSPYTIYSGGITYSTSATSGYITTNGGGGGEYKSED